MNASSSSNVSTSTLRPRTRRLISGLSEGDEGDYDSATTSPRRIASPLPSPFDSRSASPTPSPHLSRPQSVNGGFTALSGRGGALEKSALERRRRPGNESPNSLAGLWGNSWSALQGIASDLLSGDVAADPKSKILRARRPPDRVHGSQRSSTSAPPSQWGPTSQPTAKSIGVGTREEQLAALRAQKRKDLLTRQETNYADTLGKFKRRTSDDRASASAPPGENEDRDALVYVHPVQKSDTLAGITIKYNCSANTIRKANRMWPNDPVQVRDTIILPVDACGVKGKPMAGPAALDLLSSDADAMDAGRAEEVPTPNAEDINGHARARNRTNSASTSRSRTASSTGLSNVETQPAWQHDSWVMLPGGEKPTEIARLSRRALGYFPPARRKSNCYSDLDTPSTSLDIARASTQEQLLAISPIHQDPPQRPRHGRRLSNASTGYFPAYLAGPGGVGTMAKNVRVPGPAQDGLNKMFAKHLLDVAPPRHQQTLLTPELPLYTDEPTPVVSGSNTPSHGRHLNLENVGGAIESWMRRMATQAKEGMKPADRQKVARASVGAPGRGAGGIGDLIEMTDDFEIGEDEDAVPERGRQGSAVYVGPSSSATSYFDGAVERRQRSKSGKDD